MSQENMFCDKHVLFSIFYILNFARVVMQIKMFSCVHIIAFNKHD
jgi:hypothetical protein